MNSDIERAIDLIDKYPGEHNRGIPATNYLIQLAEDRLALKFPPSYKEFLRKLGYGGYFSDHYYGLRTDDFGGLDNSSLVSLTLDERKNGYFIHDIIPVCDDCISGYDVIDTTNSDEKGENPIVIWIPGCSDNIEECERLADSFGEFFYQRVKQWADVIEKKIKSS